MLLGGHGHGPGLGLGRRLCVVLLTAILGGHAAQTSSPLAAQPPVSLAFSVPPTQPQRRRQWRTPPLVCTVDGTAVSLSRNVEVEIELAREGGVLSPIGGALCMGAFELGGSGAPPRSVVERYCVAVSGNAPRYTFNLDGLSLGGTYLMRVVYEGVASEDNTGSGHARGGELPSCECTAAVGSVRLHGGRVASVEDAVEAALNQTRDALEGHRRHVDRAFKSSGGQRGDGDREANVGSGGVTTSGGGSHRRTWTARELRMLEVEVATIVDQVAPLVRARGLYYPSAEYLELDLVTVRSIVRFVTDSGGGDISEVGSEHGANLVDSLIASRLDELHAAAALPRCDNHHTRPCRAADNADADADADTVTTVATVASTDHRRQRDL